MLPMSFPGGATGPEFSFGLWPWKGSKFMPLESDLWNGWDCFPGFDLFRRSQKLAVFRVNRIFAALIVKNCQG